MLAARSTQYRRVPGPIEHDPEKWGPVFPRDKREAFARRSCSNKKWSGMTFRRKVIPLQLGLSARLDAVAHGAEPWKCLRPLVARGASNDAQRVRAAESQPLHHGDGGIVLAAGRIDTGFISGHA